MATDEAARRIKAAAALSPHVAALYAELARHMGKPGTPGWIAILVDNQMPSPGYEFSAESVSRDGLVLAAAMLLRIAAGDLRDCPCPVSHEAEAAELEDVVAQLQAFAGATEVPAPSAARH